MSEAESLWVDRLISAARSGGLAALDVRNAYFALYGNGAVGWFKIETEVRRQLDRD